MGWTIFLLSYLLGGVTFLPLVVAIVLLHAYLTFPYREDVAPSRDDDASDGIVQAGDQLGPLKAEQASQKEERASHTQHHHESNVAAGYFAVCREYTPMGINAKPIERSTPVGSTTVAAPSPSVYQTMYRSIFDRKQASGPLDSNKGPNQRPKRAGNVFYVVLRHGHLMLFDDDEQIEVRHVISLAHHDISIYSGGDPTPEGELFIKRNALCLSRKTDGLEVGPDTQVTKPFYLFSENCSAKEDFYFALLRNQEQTFAADHGNVAPLPTQFEVKNIISLVQKLHSSEEHLQTRWLNAMVGRIFLGVHKTKDLENYIRAKITKKISRVKRPSFLSGILIRQIDTGDAAPYFTNPRLKDLTVEGECGVEADVRYTGNFRIEVAATARIDLGSRFKVREVNLVLAVMVRKVEGHILFKIKPPPSNRIWFAFQQMPKMEMTIEPVVSSRQITYTVILRQIEHRIKEVIAESIVLPFWDDVPFFRTEHKKWRGGIFAGDDYVEPSPELEAAAAQIGAVDDVDRMEEDRGAAAESAELPPMEKSHSLPVLESTAPTGFFGRKLTSKGAAGSLKLSASSTSIDVRDDNNRGSISGLPPQPAQSPSFPHNASSPTVSTDATNADPFKPSSSPPDRPSAASMAAMAILSSRSQGSTPAHTPASSPGRPTALSQATSQSSSSSREATDNEKDSGQTPKPHVQRRRSSSMLDESASKEDASSAKSVPVSTKGSIKSQTGSLGRGLFRRDNTGGSAPSRPTDGAPDAQQKRTALAAVSNAAGAARRWGLNALQRHNDGSNGGSRSSGPGEREPSSDFHVDLRQPMGRGQPLPPPGVPLPGPDRRSKTGPMSVPPRRKPLAAAPGPPPLPDRRPAAGDRDHKPEQRRPVPPPPLPRRRQVSQSGPADDDEDNMLVVAAPADSEPGSPSTDEPPTYVQPWAEDEDEEEAEAEAEADGEQRQQQQQQQHLVDDDSNGDEQRRDAEIGESEADQLAGETEVATERTAEEDEKGERAPEAVEHTRPAGDTHPGHQQPRPEDAHDEEKSALHIPGDLQGRSFDDDDEDDVSAWMDDVAQPAEALVTSEGMAL